MKTKFCLAAAVLLATIPSTWAGLGVFAEKNYIEISSDLPPLRVTFPIYRPHGMPGAGVEWQLDGLTKDGVPTTPGAIFDIEGDKLKLNISHELGVGTVTFKSKWDTIINPWGTWGAKIQIPFELSSDLIVEIDGVPHFASDDPKVHTPSLINASQIIFKQASTGKMLFEIKGTFPRIECKANPNVPEQGIAIYMWQDVWQAGTINAERRMLDFPQLNWQIVFPDK